MQERPQSSFPQQYLSSLSSKPDKQKLGLMNILVSILF